MAVALLISKQETLYNLPALLTLAMVVGSCAICLLTVAIVKCAQVRDVASHLTSALNLVAILRISLRAASLSLRSAFQELSSAFPRWSRPVERYELPSWQSLPTNPAVQLASSPDMFLDPPPSYSPDGSTTGSGVHAAWRPNTPNEPAPSTSSVASKDAITDSVGTSSVPDSDALPWASFVAPWDLIAATATPRASSDLEAATGHTECHSSLDVTEAQT